MINHLGVSPNRLAKNLKLPANFSNKELFFKGVHPRVPFGPLWPNRVPCPPATVNAATLLLLINSSPKFQYSVRESLSGSSALSGSGGLGFVNFLDPF